MNKIITYVGFAIKSNSIIKGVDDILKTRKKIGLVIYSSELNQNSESKLKNFINKNKIEFKKLIKQQFDEFNLVGVKAFAITDQNLSSAIINELKNQA